MGIGLEDLVNSARETMNKMREMEMEKAIRQIEKDKASALSICYTIRY